MPKSIPGSFLLSDGSIVLGGGIPPISGKMEKYFLNGVDSLLGDDAKSLLSPCNSFFEEQKNPPVFLAGETTSTFDLAWHLHEQRLMPVWGATIAYCQIEGRGQLRRQWQSPPGNLYITFRLPDSALFMNGPAALLTGGMLCRSLRRIGFYTTLKWPNDLLNAADEKIGGILVEERDGVLLAGVGINLKKQPDAFILRKEGAPKAGILLPVEKDGKKLPLPAPYTMWRLLVNEAILEYRYWAVHDSGRVLSDFISPLLSWKGEAVVVRDVGGFCLEGRYEGINSDGGLLLHMRDNTIQTIYSGSLFRH